MAKDAEKFIAAISNFTSALEEVVAVLQEVAGNDDKKVDDLFAASESQLQTTVQMIAAIKAVRKDTTKIRSTNAEILRTVNDIKEERKKGLFSKITDPDNRRAMVDGIKSVTLIAGAVLAIGTAFKLVGDVDFTSVIALSVALPLTAHAFASIAKEKALTPGRAVEAGFITVIMAAAIGVSAYIMNSMPSITIGQGLTAITVSVAMAVSIYGLSKAVSSLGSGDIAKMMLLPVVIPITAAAIAASAFILNQMPTISVEQGLTAIAVSGAMGLILYSMGLASKSFKDVSVKDMLMLPLIMPIMASAIVASGFILNQMPPIENVGSLLIGTAAISGAVLVAGMALKGISLMGLNIKDATMGSLMMLVISGGLAASSHIIGLGDYTGGPSVEWAQAFGLAMLAMVPSTLVLGAIASTGVGALVIAAGLISMLAIAGTLVAVGEIIGSGNFSGGPTSEWAEGTGKALMYFASAMAIASPGVMDLLSGTTIKDKIDGLKSTAYAMIEVASVFNSGAGEFKNGPPKEWAEGTAQAIGYFVKAMNDVGENAFDKISQFFGGESREEKINALKGVAYAMIEVATVFSGSQASFTNGPSSNWAEGTGKAIMGFATMLSTIGDSIDIDDINDGTSILIKLVSKMPMVQAITNKLNASISGNLGIGKAATDVERLARGYTALALSMQSMTDALKATDPDKLPATTSIASTMLALSLINAQALDETLKVISKGSESVKTLFAKVAEGQTEGASLQISKIGDDLAGNKISTIGGLSKKSVDNVTTRNQSQSNPLASLEAKLDNLISLLTSIDGNVIEIVDNNDIKTLSKPISN